MNISFSNIAQVLEALLPSNNGSNKATIAISQNANGTLSIQSAQYFVSYSAAIVHNKQDYTMRSAESSKEASQQLNESLEARDNTLPR